MAVSTLEKALRLERKELAGNTRGHSEIKPADLLQMYRGFLRTEEHRLRLAHHDGARGRQLTEERCQVIDAMMRDIFEQAILENVGDEGDAPPVTLVALGGYGRGELNPYSDIDVMFLHAAGERKLPPVTNAIITKILYLLWDIGFKVGHSTRTVAAVIKQCNQDMLTKTSLLEARLVAGDKQLFLRMEDEFEKHCIRPVNQAKAYINWRLLNQAERHAKHGGTVFVQEPNIKNGCGGLRDYQNLLWVSYFQMNTRSMTTLVEKKILTTSERRLLKDAHDFLLRVRTELHYLNKRANDQLTLFHQAQISTRFGYPQKNNAACTEAFMRDYFRHARNIFLISRAVCERLSIPVPGFHTKPGLLAIMSPNRIREKFDGFFSANGQIYFQNRQIFHDDPFRLMRVFLHAQNRGLSLSGELQRLMRRRLDLVTRSFQYAAPVRESFMAILSHKGQVGRILRMMHEVDFLGRYLPEFGTLTCLVQHEFFHVYTADEHTLVCLEKLDELIDTEQSRDTIYRKIFEDMESPELLYLGLLLHDVGKSTRQRSHAEASAMLANRVCRRLAFSPDRRRAVVSLVDNHILLSQTAQTRNLDDPVTIEWFAEVIRTRHDLDRLFLLTMADAKGTTEHAWSDWKETLARHLYTATGSFLEGGRHERRSVVRQNIQALVRKKLPRDFSDEIQAHFDSMEDRYFYHYEVSEIVSHLRLVREFIARRMEDPSFWLGAATEWKAFPAQGHSIFSLVTWNRRALFRRIAGSFAVAQINILSADIYTRKDSLVLDFFRVCTTRWEPVDNPRSMALVEKHLHESLQNEDDQLASLIAKAQGKHSPPLYDFPTKIAIINDLSPEYTLVEVRTPDRLGLLYDLLKTFDELDIDIALSRITTEKGAALDSFYVTTRGGKKISTAQEIRRLQEALSKSTAPQTVEAADLASLPME
ncbi:MAG: [protein-PII] uridylyltransferase [Verrucomicrobiales bacterium]